MQNMSVAAPRFHTLAAVSRGHTIQVRRMMRVQASSMSPSSMWEEIQPHAAITVATASQVIAAFNRVRMLTQDWGVIVEALTGSPVVEIGAGGALLRAREGWANWVLPPDQRDKSVHAPLAAPSPAVSAAQTPLKSPQRPRTVADTSSTAHTAATGPVDSSLSGLAMPSNNSSAADAPSRAEDATPAADTVRPAATTAGDAGETAPQVNEEPAPADSAATAATDAAAEPAVTVPGPVSTAGDEPSVAAQADLQPSATSAAAVQSAEVTGTSTEPAEEAVPGSAAPDVLASAVDAAEPNVVASSVNNHCASGEDSTANEQAAPVSAASGLPASAPADEPHAARPAGQSAGSAGLATTDSGSAMANPGDAPAPAPDAATASAAAGSAVAPVAAAGSGPRTSEDLEDDMFQLDEVRGCSHCVSVVVHSIPDALAPARQLGNEAVSLTKVDCL